MGRVGGVVVFSFNGATCVTFPDDSGFVRTHDDTPQWGLVTFCSNDCDNGIDNGIGVIGRVGPILYNDFAALPRRMDVPDLVRFLTDHPTINNTALQILVVGFPESEIKGLLPLLKDTTTGELSTSE